MNKCMVKSQFSEHLLQKKKKKTSDYECTHQMELFKTDIV